MVLNVAPQKKRKKKKKGGGEFVAARVAIVSATRWTGNKPFFKGGLISHISGVTLPFALWQQAPKLIEWSPCLSPGGVKIS